MGPFGRHSLLRRPGLVYGIGEAGPVVGEDSVDLVENGADQVEQKVCSRFARRLCNSTKANFEVRSIATIK
jgi:hypothetical protein